MAQEQFIFRALRQQLLWPSIHAAVDVYQRRRASNADNYELIWRLIHICECTIITLASAAISRVRHLGKNQEFLELRERCYGITWNATEASLEKGPGALDGSIDKWIELGIPLTQPTTTCRFGQWRITREPSRSSRSGFRPRTAVEPTW